MSARHRYETLASKNGNYPQSRCKECGLSRMLVGVVKGADPHAGVHSRVIYLFRVMGGFSWTSFYPACVKSERRVRAVRA